VTVQQIRAIARSLGINGRKMNKADLVRAIQSAEGNEQCFATGRAVLCGQTTCLWKDDCN